MTEQLIPAGPVPMWVAWFFDADSKEWETPEDAKHNINVSPVIAWLITPQRMPVPVSAHDGEIRGPDMLRFIGASPEEARRRAEELALSRVLGRSQGE
jgi:hypothetical protein